MAAAEAAARRAALLLHGLHASHRTQVLARLDPTDATRLGALLDELASLGLPASLGQQLLDDSSPLPRPESAPSLQQRVAQLNVDEALRALARSSPQTAARLLGTAPWPWRNQALDRTPQARRSALLELLRHDAAPLPPAALELLYGRLLREAAEVPSGAPTHAVSTGDLRRRWRATCARMTSRARKWLAWTR